jgi:hypothetical protein
MKSLVLLVPVVAAACGSTPPASTTTWGGGAATAVLPDVPFEELDHDQRIAFMKQTVVPTMMPLFQQHDPEEFEDFGCKTCHGDGAERGEFHMPNDALPKLNFSNMSKFEADDVEWMTRTVKPTMARLLREAEYSAQNPQGFGCLHCHRTER